ncbi:MAG: GNAT family N-acetyltransferase [Bacteroidales bacterium]
MTIKPATPADTPLILEFIKAIASYEKLLHEVEATEEVLHQSLFGENANAKVIIAYEEEKPVGFALYFYNFSTFKGRKGLYLEDLFVYPQHRGKGYGKALLLHLAQQAQEENCGRMEWIVLDWTPSAIEFYHSVGAKAMDEWTVFRLTMPNK